MSIDRGMDKEDVHIYSAIKNYEMMSFAATSLGLEIVTLSGIRQRRRNIM